MASMPSQAPPLVVAADPRDAQAQALANALHGAGWNPIVTATPGQYVGYARVCVVYLASDTTANQIAQAAIQAGFPCLIPVTAQPMPLLPANWAVPAIVIGANLSLALLNLIPIIAHFLAPLPPTVAPPLTGPPAGAPPLGHPTVTQQPQGHPSVGNQSPGHPSVGQQPAPARPPSVHTPPPAHTPPGPSPIQAPPPPVGTATGAAAAAHGASALVRVIITIISIITVGVVVTGAAVIIRQKQGVAKTTIGSLSVTSTHSSPGTLKWTYQINASSLSSPALANGILYFGADDGNLHAIKASDGSAVWTYQAGGLVSAPIVDNGVVYFIAIDHNVSDMKIEAFFAVNASNGSLLWTFSDNGNIVGAFTESNGLALVDFDCLGCQQEGTLFAFNASDGTRVWTQQIDHILGITIAGNTIYLAKDLLVGGVYVSALNTNDGSTEWQTRVDNGDNSTSTPLVIDGNVYIGAGDGDLFDLHASNGSILWKFPTANTVTAEPTISNGVIFIGSQDNNVYAIHADNGTLLWKYATGSNIVDSSPVVVDNIVYIGSYDHSLYAIHAQDGSISWKFQTQGMVASTPVITNGILYFGSDDGTVYALYT